METPVNHWEYTEFEKLMGAKFEALQAEDKRTNERLKIVEQQSQQIMDISLNMQKQTANIETLAKNMESICRIQEAEGKRLQELEDNRIADDEIMSIIQKQDERLKAIETADFEKYKAAKKQVRTTAITAAVTAIISAIVSAGITLVVTMINFM